MSEIQNKWIVTGIFVRKPNKADILPYPVIITVICNFEIPNKNNYNLEKTMACAKAYAACNIDDGACVLQIDAEKIDYTIDDYPVYEKLWIRDGFCRSSSLSVQKTYEAN